MSIQPNPVATEPDADQAVPTGPCPRHVAIIMDGNGRWAAQRGLQRSEGHRRGVEAVREVVRAAPEFGIRYLTLFSFSSENWSRPPDEVNFLFSLLRLFIQRDLADLHRNGVRVTVIGERRGLPDDICNLLDEAEHLTHDNQALHLIVAFNYGGRGEIARAATRVAREVLRGEIDPDSITEETVAANLDTRGLPDPDLVIRTSGERRMSNFLLWQTAYSELVFLPCYWPDFDRRALFGALEDYRRRDRRFGGLAAGAGG